MVTGYRVEVQGITLQFLARTQDFSLLQSTQIGSAADPASYSLGTKAFFNRSKADKARR